MIGTIEIVGLSLAIFPLVISLLEHYEDGYNSLGDWVFFRREFANLVNSLGREQIIFRQHIEGMLRSITDSEFELKELMDNVRSPRWESDGLSAKLKHKLSGVGEYDNYNLSIKAIHDHLVNMQKRLGRCAPPKSDGTAQRRLHLQRRLRKFQFAIRRSKWQDEVENLGRQIDRVTKLFGEAEALTPARQSKNSETALLLARTKDQASSLHKAITLGWRECDCHPPHAFKLFMIHRPHKTHSQAPESGVLRISFPQSISSMGKHDNSPGSENVWYGFNARIIYTNKARSQPAEPATRNDFISISEAVDQSSAASVSTRSYHRSTWSDDTSLSKVDSLSSYGTIDTALKNTDAVRIEDLCQALRAREKAECLGYLSDGQGAHHVLNTNSTISFTSDDVEDVISLASILTAEQSTTRESSYDRKTNAAVNLTRAQRMSVALTLSYAMLELYPTPWLPRTFSKMDVYFFVRKTGDLITDDPFLVCQVASGKSHTSTKSAITTSPLPGQDHSDALLALGIMIMELWFGQTIESRPFWNDHCGQDGKAKRFTSLTAAMEWQKKAIGEAGIILHDVTNRCIRGNVGPTTIDLDDPNCVRAVFDQIIKPLEGLVGHFWPR